MEDRADGLGGNRQSGPQRRGTSWHRLAVGMLVVCVGAIFFANAGGAQAAEPTFGEALSSLKSEIAADGGTIDGVIEHYGGSLPTNVSAELDRYLGEQAAINSTYGGGTAMTSGMSGAEVTKALGAEADTTFRTWIESGTNSATVDTDAVAVQDTLSSSASGGVTELAAGGELADLAAGSGVLPAVGSFVAGWLAPAAASFVAGYAVGTEFMNLIGGGGSTEDSVYEYNGVEVERWEKVNPGEWWEEGIERDFAKENGYEVGGYGPGANGPVGCFYECYGKRKNETNHAEYLLVVRDPCYFSTCTHMYYDDATVYTMLGAPPEKFVKPDSFSCEEYPFTDPELPGWPPHFLRHHVKDEIVSGEFTQQGCKLAPESFLYISFESVAVTGTADSVPLGFPRSSKTSGVTYTAVTTKPLLGNEGITKALLGQNETSEQNSHIEAGRLIDHAEKVGSGPEGMIPLLPGVATHLAQTLLTQNATFNVSTEQAEDIAERCVLYQVRAGLSEAQGVSECEKLPIFASGSDVPSATEHDLKALNPLDGGEPGWVRLNYESATVKEGKGESREWYKGQGGCAGEKPADDSCDEYPFFATQQGGPPKVGYPTPSLEYINSVDNEKQGSQYGGFVTSCKMSERGTTDYAFLAVPIPPVLGIPTALLCN